MHAAKAPTPGTTSPSASIAASRVGGDGDVGPDPFEGTLRRAQVARSVVEDDDPLHRLSTPLVDGTPCTRGSSLDGSAQRAGDRLVLRLGHVVPVAARSAR